MKMRKMHRVALIAVCLAAVAAVLLFRWTQRPDPMDRAPTADASAVVETYVAALSRQDWDTAAALADGSAQEAPAAWPAGSSAEWKGLRELPVDELDQVTALRYYNDTFYSDQRLYLVDVGLTPAEPGAERPDGGAAFLAYLGRTGEDADWRVVLFQPAPDEMWEKDDSEREDALPIHEEFCTSDTAYVGPTFRTDAGAGALRVEYQNTVEHPCKVMLRVSGQTDPAETIEVAGGAQGTLRLEAPGSRTVRVEVRSTDGGEVGGILDVVQGDGPAAACA